MSRTLQFKRYPTSVVANTKGADGELIIDTNNYIITVHNANTFGGIRLATENSVSIVSGVANVGYAQALTSYVVATNAQTLANTANNTANAAYVLAAQEPVGSQAYVMSEAAIVSSQAAFNQANSANVLAQAAFDTANNASGGSIVLAQSSFNQANNAYNQANAANILAQAAFNFANTSNAILTGIDTAQNVAITNGYSFTQAAFNFANTTNNFTQSAYNQANNASNGFIQNAQTAAYTLQSTDAGKYLYYTPAANVILYLPWTSNISFTNGTTIMVVSQNTGAAANIVVTPNVNVSLFTAGNTISGSHNVNPYGVATLIMVKANTWFMTGSGIN